MSFVEVENLEVAFRTYGGFVQAVRGVSFSIERGETVALVGESGSGKSVTAKSIFGMIQSNKAVQVNGSIKVADQAVLSLTSSELRALRGRRMGMIFQDPMTSLNPTLTIETQLTEGMVTHLGITKRQAKERALDLLDLVGIPNPKVRVGQYPHHFSGGQRQRIVIAMALACNPSLLIADEPTTALDVTIQAQILELLEDLKEKLDLSILLITHDLGVVAQVADRVMVMYTGKLVETGDSSDIFKAPAHPYTKGLLESIPNLNSKREDVLQSIPGTPPDLFQPPKGCGFVDRCPMAMEVCDTIYPPMTVIEQEHKTACWLQDPRARQAFSSSAIQIYNGKGVIV
ncbi:ABC transporter ATP-binding protein [Bacillus sp. 165]|uniref:ABC transporter ATP-binding protein n=1 Tax=Bacillus sp. 165 TaxID=1529117 RepID=UPI001ADD58B4|nr:ABC transporter ATP-binding protein [Bacillus sp. 165]MBO9130101.1 ABC transporter ATP-binding protein [Bacillus sp. 165]